MCRRVGGRCQGCQRGRAKGWAGAGVTGWDLGCVCRLPAGIHRTLATHAEGAHQKEALALTPGSSCMSA
mgnify:CR=1 FL=1